MKPGHASSTAALVAALRGLAAFLPETHLRSLAPDPYGLALAGVPYTWLASLLRRSPRLAGLLFSNRAPLRRLTLGLALRTRCLDDAARAFFAAGGRQVLILGAGLDARALRLGNELLGVVWFEVDHPDSQSAKRAALPQARDTRYVAHDFEADTTGGALPAKLRGAGFDASRRTLVLWEGVIMYLTQHAIEQSVRMLHALLAPGSQLCVTYLALTQQHGGTGTLRILRRRAATLPFLLWLRLYAREPFRSPRWPPGQLAAWLSTRGFRPVWDVAPADVARAAGADADTIAALSDTRRPMPIRERFALAERV